MNKTFHTTVVLTDKAANTKFMVLALKTKIRTHV